MTSESVSPDDTISYDEVEERIDREQDGASSYHDIEAEAGDEEEVEDSFLLDEEAARESGVNLDRIGGETPELD